MLSLKVCHAFGAKMFFCSKSIAEQSKERGIGIQFTDTQNHITLVQNETTSPDLVFYVRNNGVIISTAKERLTISLRTDI